MDIPKRGFLQYRKTGIVVLLTVVYVVLGYGLDVLPTDKGVDLLLGIGAIGALVSRLQKLLGPLAQVLPELGKLIRR